MSFKHLARLIVPRPMRAGLLRMHRCVGRIIDYASWVLLDGLAVATGRPLRHLAWTIVGIVVLVAGSELMVHGGIEIARSFGVSEAIIGLTLVAFGTSLRLLLVNVQ